MAVRKTLKMTGGEKLEITGTKLKMADREVEYNAQEEVEDDGDDVEYDGEITNGKKLMVAGGKEVEDDGHEVE